MIREVFDWIARILRSPREPYNSRPDGLLRLDLARLRDNLQPAVKGQAAGRANVPQSSSLIPDTRELEILRACQDAADKALKDTKANCEALLMSIEQLLPSRQAALIASLQSSAIGSIRELIANIENEVRRQSRHCSELTTSFAAFKVEHGLSRPAMKPASKVLLVGALFAMVVIESGMNGVWFAEGSAQGLVGGIAQALVFAIVNVTIGFVAGRVPVRYILHRSVLVKAFAAIGVVAYLGLALALNLAIAHYRDLAQVSADQAGVGTVQALISHPLGLKDFSSWLLFGMGVFFSGFACLDGFKFDDPYPGYGPRSRELTEAQDELSSICDEAISDISRIKAA